MILLKTLNEPSARYLFIGKTASAFVDISRQIINIENQTLIFILANIIKSSRTAEIEATETKNLEKLPTGELIRVALGYFLAMLYLGDSGGGK